MSRYNHLEFHFVKNMPKALPGLIVGNAIYINDNKSKTEQYETLFEEIGHSEKSVGYIADYSDPLAQKQELEARRWAFINSVPLDELIYCYEHHIHTIDDLTEHFEVTAEYFNKVLETYRNKFGEIFEYNHYKFDLRSGLNIKKM